MKEEVDHFVLNSEEMRKVYQTTNFSEINQSSKDMYELCHYLVMNFNKKIMNEVFDSEQLVKLLKNILTKYEKEEIKQFIKDKDIFILAAIFEYSFMRKEWEEFEEKKRFIFGKNY
jgi:regulator of sirC expression with transglutaminase-like and TPR domain